MTVSKVVIPQSMGPHLVYLLLDYELRGVIKPFITIYKPWLVKRGIMANQPMDQAHVCLDLS